MNFRIRAVGFFGLVLVLGAGWMQHAAAQTAEDALRYTERSPATGARMTGLAGAGISGVADFSALYNNPAGLGYFQRSAFSGAFNSVYVTDNAFSDSPGFDALGIDEDVSKTSLGNLAYVYRAPTRQGSFVVGLAYNQIHSFERRLRFSGTNTRNTISTSFLPYQDEYSLGANDNLDVLSDLPFAAFNGGVIEFFPEFLDGDPNAYPFLEAAIPGTTIDQTGSVIESGRMSEVNFGGAVEASRDVMIGFSANLVFGNYNFDSSFDEVDALDQNTADDYSVLLDDGGLLEGFDYLTYGQFLETDLIGVNARAGVSAMAAPNVRIGLSVETPTYYEIDETYGQTFETGFDDGGVLSYGDRVDDVGSGDFEYKIITPWRFGVGVGLHADNVTILADAEVIDWSQLRMEEEFEEDRAFFDDLNRTIEENYNAVINGRLGIEYRLGDVMLRGGVAYMPDPLDKDVDLRKSNGSTLDRDKLFFSAGLGYRFNDQFQIDVGWMQGRFDGSYSAYPEDDFGPRQDDTLVIDEEVVRNQFVVGVSFSF